MGIITPNTAPQTNYCLAVSKVISPAPGFNYFNRAGAPSNRAESIQNFEKVVVRILNGSPKAIDPVHQHPKEAALVNL